MQEMQKILRYKNGSKKWKIILLLLLLFIGIGLYFFYTSSKDVQEPVIYVSKPLKRGDMTLTVSATGYLEPTQTVTVGTEVSGTINKVYVDYNDKVKKGEILAQIDKTKYLSAMNQAKASLNVSKASLASANAKLRQTQETFERDKKLRKATKGALPSQQTWDNDESAYLVAKAGVATAKAQLSQAQQQVVTAQYDLDRTTIYSPINGTILVRNIDPGQTVAASFQTPTLFQIANDLTKMQLQVNVDEADIAKVKSGEDATFSVDAYPSKLFKAHVSLVRVNSQTVDGVVTYIAELDVNNSKLLLYPGMSADANIITKELTDKFIVPRAALLYIPIKPQTKKMFGFGKRPETIKVDPKPHIWILKNGKPDKIYVTVLGNNGAKTAIVSKELKIGNKVIIMQEKHQ
jgi:HlyD family secretion protein